MAHRHRGARFVSLVFASVTLFAAVDPAQAATVVTTDIVANTVWTLANSPFVLPQEIAVQPGATLTIEPGVIVKLYGGSRLDIYGSLIAQGTSNNSIYFTSYLDDTIGGDTNGDGAATKPNHKTPNNSGGIWWGLLFNASEAVSVQHVVLAFSSFGFVFQATHGSASDITAINNQHNLELFADANVTVSRADFGTSIYESVYMQDSVLTADHLTTGGSQNYEAIGIRRSNFTLADSLINNSSRRGALTAQACLPPATCDYKTVSLERVTTGDTIFAYEGVTLDFKHSLSTGGGINTYGQSTLNVEDSTISQSFYGIWDYGEGDTINITRSKIINNVVGIYLFSPSRPPFPNTVIHASNVTVSGNTQYGVFNENAYSVDLRNTSWGDDSGPYHPVLNPTGSANAVSDYVLFIPYKSSATTGTITVTSLPTGASFEIRGAGSSKYTGATPATIDNVPVGSYEINWGSLAGGYATPVSETRALFVGGTLQFTGLYKQLPANPTEIAVRVTPPGNVTTLCYGQRIYGYFMYSGTYPDTSHRVEVNVSDIDCEGALTAGQFSLEGGLFEGSHSTPDGPYWVTYTQEGSALSPNYLGTWYYFAATRTLGVWTTPPQPTNVIVIPGIMGSFLYSVTGFSTLWLDPVNVFLSGCDSDLLRLALDVDGITAAPNTTTPCAKSPVSGVPAEAIGLLQYDVNELGFHSKFSYNPVIDGLRSNGFSPTSFSYDWRLDYATIAGQLRDTIMTLTSKPGTTVDVVAHSQGGLILRTYLSTYGADARVNNVVYLGTPHRGAPKSYAMLRGWTSFEHFFGDAVPHVDFRTSTALVQNFPAVYELLPRYSFLSVDGARLLSFTDTYLRDVSSGALTNDALVDRSLSLWSAIGNSNPVPKARSFAINGSGRVTLSGLDEKSTNDCLQPFADATGDGTVPTLSGSGLPNTQYYYVDEGHQDLPQSTLVTKKVVELLKGDVALEAGFALTPFTTKSKYWTAHTCSPVTIRVTDSSGNSTGIDGQHEVLEEIPDSQVFDFGKTQGLFVPDGGFKTFTLTGTGDGTFTFVLDAEDPQSGSGNVFAFRDVPISVGLHATVVVGESGVSPTMSVDLDGDGRSDIVLNANASVPSGAYIGSLLHLVSVAGLQKGIENDLTASLKASQSSLLRGNTRAAANQLMAFESKLDSQSRFISAGQRTLFRALADKALFLLR